MIFGIRVGDEMRSPLVAQGISLHAEQKKHRRSPAGRVSHIGWHFGVQYAARRGNRPYRSDGISIEPTDAISGAPPGPACVDTDSHVAAKRHDQEGGRHTTSSPRISRQPGEGSVTPTATRHSSGAGPVLLVEVGRTSP